MRESVFFELRLRRFGVGRTAIWLVAVAAVAAMAAWAAAMWDSQSESRRARVAADLLSCIDGVWALMPEAGVPRTGTLEVAMDLGAFLLLRLVVGGRTSAWLPVQRRGLEAQWHGLRCAVYSPPPVAAVAPTATAVSSR